METGEEFFLRDDVNLTDVRGALAREGADTTTPSKSRRELSAKEKRELELVLGKPELTEAQADALIVPLSTYIMNPNVKTAWEVTKALRKDDRAGRRQKLEDRVQQLIVEEGIDAELAIDQAKREALSGKYPTLTTDYFSELTDEARKAYFSKVSHFLKDEGFEMVSTKTALTNALAGRPIPSDPGTTGRSALTRLQRVFGTGKEFQALEKISKKKSLRDTIEGIYYEVGYPPIPIDQETADYLRGLSDIGRVVPLFERAPVSRSAKIVEATFAKVLPQLTVAEKQTISRVLSELGFSPIDIGNLLRANVASFDLSFWRQMKTLALGHPINFYRGNIEAWKALLSQKAAEANWEWVRAQPSYPYYVEMVEQTGFDFLRIFIVPKGTAQHFAAEEFGMLTAERWLPRMTAKIPWVALAGRHFVTGINTTNILIYNDALSAAMRRAEKIASGEIILKEGESFSIQGEMNDWGKYLANLSQRGSLGKARALAPTINSMFFSARSKLGRLFTPLHLIDSNPRVRRMAWKDLGLFIGLTTSLIMLGKYMDWWDVDTDPRSGEFMSVRIGNLRIDPWAGNRQYLVLYTRIITQTGVSSVTGAEYEADPIRALTSFMRSSLSPFASIITDSITGKNFLGEELDVADPKQWINRVAPFAVQDIWEAFDEGWVEGNIAILPAILGEGVQTYTGDWSENFTKLGTPKYQENTAYGITEPVYDVKDLWADTAARFKDVSVEELTEEKGYPEFIRSMVETRNELLPIINSLPNTPLYQMNADPARGTTFIQYYEMWQDREKIVATGDEEALKAFDSDERTNDAYKGNITQQQYSLLVQYHSLSEEDQEIFLDKHSELKDNPREEWLKSHPSENAKLSIWGQADLKTSAAYRQARKIIDELEIPDSALFGIPPAKLGDDYTGYLDLLETGVSVGSDDAHFYRLIHPEYDEWHTESWKGTGTVPVKVEVAERYPTEKLKKLLEEYDNLRDEDGNADSKARDELRYDNALLDAYKIHAEGLVPVLNSGWEKIKLSQVLEWYKLGKAKDKKVTSELEPRDIDVFYIPIPAREHLPAHIQPLWDEYDALRKPDGSADSRARRIFRYQHPELNAYGIEQGWWGGGTTTTPTAPTTGGVDISELLD